MSTVDDGSSQTLELTYEHNCLQVFQQAQRMAEAQKRAPPSTYAYGPSTVLKRAQPPPLPPAEHFPSVEVGDTVKVRARVKQWSANIHFVIGSDLGALHTRIYPVRPTFADRERFTTCRCQTS